MRAADAIDKITINKPEFLSKHKKDIVKFLSTTIDKEFKWHLALMIPRLNLSDKELRAAWDKLSQWAMDTEESRIVRVNSIQSLFDMASRRKAFEAEIRLISEQIKSENVPSLKARLKKLKRKGNHT